MRYFSSAAEEKKLVRTGAGKLLALHLTNVTGATKYVYVFDGISTVGLLVGIFDVATISTRVIDLVHAPIPFGTGIYVASSSAITAYTATTTADFLYGVEYAPRG